MKWRRNRPTDTGGAAARKRAEAELVKVKKQTREYAELAAELRDIGERNHLAAAFLLAARGRRHD